MQAVGLNLGGDLLIGDFPFGYALGLIDFATVFPAISIGLIRVIPAINGDRGLALLQGDGSEVIPMPLLFGAARFGGWDGVRVYGWGEGITNAALAGFSGCAVAAVGAPLAGTDVHLEVGGLAGMTEEAVITFGVI